MEHKRELENFNRFNETFVEAYKAERNVKRLPAKEKEAQGIKPLEEFVNVSTVKDFEATERLSKRLARMGVASRRMAERLIQQGMI